jgi:hypothetical protein
MKKMTILTLALTLLVTVSVTDGANASWFKKDKKVEAESPAHRFELFPSMSFFSGTIRQDTYSGWRLDDMSLQLMGSSSVSMDGSDEAYLQEGQSVVVMGVKYGSTVVAYRVRVLKPDYGYGDGDINVKKQPGPHPSISIGKGPQ